VIGERKKKRKKTHVNCARSSYCLNAQRIAVAARAVIVFRGAVAVLLKNEMNPGAEAEDHWGRACKDLELQVTRMII
jgi:hypothetical protein